VLRTVAAAIVLAAVLAASWWSVGRARPAAAKPQSRPNIILIVTDDQTVAQLNEATMPNTLELLGAQGTTFEDTIATTPLCCPSRASMITGQYGHNNGVLANAGGYKHLEGKRNVLPVWLRDAGYYTAHVGRWLQGYKGFKVAPGWDEWLTMVGEDRFYFGYELSDDGDKRHFASAPRDYVTRVLNQAALRVVRRRVGSPKPFYLQLDQLAPHADGFEGGSGGECAHSAIPPSLAPAGFENAALPIPPSFNEPDVADKPSFMRILPSLSDQQIAEIERQWRCRLASLPSVDEGVRRIVATLEQAGELDDTAIIFVSDNGYFFGEHRVRTEKYLAYEEAIRLPLLIRFPGGAGAGAVVDAPVANIDLAPTILELAGASPCIGKKAGVCRVIDGRSLLPLVQGGAWPQGRALALELARKAGVANAAFPCTYQGVRVQGQVYIEHSSVPDADGVCQPAFEVEHYDLGADPYELQNLYPAAPGSGAAAAEAELAARVAALSDCAGIEGRDPVPPSGHYCE
jgi:N-acetylglucosamine-6-sulfatase